ncbi:MAG: hypothetical protein HQL96_00620 [Magnetococcales bacterium]|nr:hypothetical protein [Magnetococcales bacterium]
MKKSLWIGIALLVAASGSAMAADAVRGKELHDKSCKGACHASRGNGNPDALYQRPNRKETLEKLKVQVSFCNQQVLKSEWFPEDEADVVAYLNATFYHFK